MQVTVTVDGTDAEVEAFWDWLRDEPDLRGGWRAAPRTTSSEAMGAPVEFVVDFVRLHGDGAAILASAVYAYLRTRERFRRVTVKFTGSDGRTVSVSTPARTVEDLERLVRTVTDSVVTSDTRTTEGPEAERGGA